MLVKPKVIINSSCSALKSMDNITSAAEKINIDSEKLLQSTLDILGNSNKYFAKKLKIKDFVPIRKIDVNRALRCPDDEILFFKNGQLAFPNLHKDSLFSEFKIIKSISDETLAKQHLEDVTFEIVNKAEEYYRQLGINKKITAGLNPHNTIYDYIRAANYSENQTVRSSINAANYFEKLMKPCNGIRTIDTFGWIYHVPKTYVAGEQAKWRLSLNAKIDEGFIGKLDNYCVNNNVNTRFKMPDTLQGACNRPDTYTMYFYDDLNTELSAKVRKDIINLVKPYVRQVDNVYPVGKELSKGVFICKEPTTEDLKDLMKVLYAINPAIARKMTLTSSHLKYPTGYDAKKLSAGQVEAAKILIRMLLDNRF